MHNNMYKYLQSHLGGELMAQHSTIHTERSRASVLLELLHHRFEEVRENAKWS